jgi:hypothetical protein
VEGQAEKTGKTVRKVCEGIFAGETELLPELGWFEGVEGTTAAVLLPGCVGLAGIRRRRA